MNLLPNKVLIRHLKFWVFFTIYACIIDPINSSLVIQSIGTLLIIGSYAFTYYVELFFIFPKFYKKKIILFFSIVLTFIIFYSIKHYTYNVFMKTYGIDVIISGKSSYTLLVNAIIVFTITSIMALGAYQNKIGIDKIKMKNEKEKVLLLKELGFLKNQFNSHITFNFLNYCYGRIHKSSTETAEAIEIFSRMLRYSMNNKPSEKVLLKKEIEYIQDFIALQKLLTTSICIHFSVVGIVNSVHIIPRILITFVENAFKHGNIDSPENPINIELACSPRQLFFKVTNKKQKQLTLDYSGIGQNNVKKQLDLSYKDKYELNIEENEITYSSTLILTI